MSLQVLVLTTETPHHIHFVRELVQAGHRVSVLSEQQVIHAQTDATDLEVMRQEFEHDRWFSEGLLSFNDLCLTRTVTSINSAEALCTLMHTVSDVSIVFGTRWIKADALRLLPDERWNLHGGDPQKYRGLDSHLWALYHDDHDALITTVHTLDPHLDAGEIIAGSRIDIASAPELHMLRAANTDLAVQLVKGSLAHLEAVGQVSRLPQASVGRYYSALPAALWTRCAKSYARALRGWSRET